MIWTASRPTSNINNAQYLYDMGVKGDYVDAIYWYATITTVDKKYHFSLFAAKNTNRFPGIPAAHIEIVEEAGFEPSLKFVSASEMAGAMASEGRVAIYGIQFDLDSAKLRAESMATLDEIAKAIRADPGLSVYVVGHTDNQGSHEYNMDLSERRARSVVSALSTDHGIDTRRLIAVGVGQVAPVASNDNEEGRSKNRRVELVKR